MVGGNQIRLLHASATPLEVLQFLEDHGVCGKQIHFTATPGAEPALTLVLTRENLHHEEALRPELARRFGASLQLIDRLGAVSAIGTGINATHENLLRGSACLAAKGIDVRGLATSSFRITWLVPDEHANDAVRALHALYLEPVATLPQP